MTFGLCDWLCRAREIKLNDKKSVATKCLAWREVLLIFTV